MSQPSKNGGNAYRERFAEYGKIYSESWPKPDPALMKGGGDAAAGGVEGALKRQVRHNDKSTTQTSKVTGV
jgi:hypothetical protein